MNQKHDRAMGTSIATRKAVDGTHQRRDAGRKLSPWIVPDGDAEERRSAALGAPLVSR
jgi:hypothetical protein